LEITEWLTADVLVTDPPYGIDGHLSASWKGRKPPGFKRRFDKPQWDTSLDVRNRVLEMWGHERPAAVFASPKRLDDPAPFREVPLVWDKGNIGMGDVSFPWGPSYELIYVSGPGWAGKREGSVINVGPHSPSQVTKVGHPTPKPISLMERLVSKAPSGVVADPFAGGGATLIAARNLGRSAIGVELEERYCEIIAKRLAQGVLL
jgi:site-specific DNA-methyltransferase (adenine-specific)